MTSPGAMPSSEEQRIRDLVRRVVLRTLGGIHPVTVKPGRQLVTESDLTGVSHGGTLKIPAGALISPLALEVAGARKISLVKTSLVSESKKAASPREAVQPARADARTVALGADHGGYELKELVKDSIQKLGYRVIDCGTDSGESVDYPDFAFAAARLVAQGKAWRGILVDGAGIGSCMAANKVPGVRAAMCYDEATAVNSREHNHSNVLTLGAGMIDVQLALQIVHTWLATEDGDGRHERRVKKIMDIEQRYLRA